MRNYPFSTGERFSYRFWDPDHYYHRAVVVFTDGCCLRNGQYGARAGYGVFWGEGRTRDNQWGSLEGSLQTNNRAELRAVEVAIEQAIYKEMDRLVIVTDSEYLIKSLDRLDGWRRAGWRTNSGYAVKNQDLLKRIHYNIRKNIKVLFFHVNGHSGIYGNDMADMLANNGADE